MKCLTTVNLFIIILISSIFISGQNTSSTPVQQSLSKQTQEIGEFIKRLEIKEHQNLLEGALWTVTHDYSDFKHMSEVLNTFQIYIDAIGKYQSGSFAPLEEMGGIKAFKNKLAEWLSDEDPAIRAFAATVLGISGDSSYASPLAQLIKERKYKNSDLLIYDRGQAAMALGLVGAKEYIPIIVKLLKSSNEYDRAGAIYGLGFLKARGQALAVAKLLNDKNESVREAAKEALAMMGEANLIKNQKSKKANK